MIGIDQYKSVNTSGASPHELIQMLFDTYVLRVDQTIEAINSNDLNLKAKSSAKAIAILGGLEEGLNIEEGGELAENLQAIYRYARECILKASAKNDVQPLIEAKQLITQIQTAWREIGTNSATR